MHIIIYDPLYSTIGHYTRYNAYVLEITSCLPHVNKISFLICQGECDKFKYISDKIDVVALSDENRDIQVSHMEAKGIWEKITNHFRVYGIYRDVIRRIDAMQGDLVIFTSQGQLPFWLAVKAMKKSYAVSAMSLKWLYSKKGFSHFLYTSYQKFLQKARVAFVTELCYVNILEENRVKNCSVLHDRYLENKTASVIPEKNRQEETLRLVTVGTLSQIKSPIPFAKALMQVHPSPDQVSYKISGKSMDGTGEELQALIQRNELIEYRNEYISEQLYIDVLQGCDYVVIPYDAEYVKFLTSGVMWDCFMLKKPVICPDYEPFRHYIKQYGIGFCYDPAECSKFLEQLVRRDLKIDSLNEKYRIMTEALGKNRAIHFMHNIVEGSRTVHS
jgi:glycosyltransferase involved in cell wall biosynthesis